MDKRIVLKERLELFQNIKQEIDLIVKQYESEINILANQMSICSNLEEFSNFFDKLHDIQEILAMVFYKFDFKLNDSLSSFVYHLDRDDEFTRKYWYMRFTQGFTWTDEP